MCPRHSNADKEEKEKMPELQCWQIARLPFSLESRYTFSIWHVSADKFAYTFLICVIVSAVLLLTYVLHLRCATSWIKIRRFFSVSFFSYHRCLSARTPVPLKVGRVIFFFSFSFIIIIIWKSAYPASLTFKGTSLCLSVSVHLNCRHRCRCCCCVGNVCR